MVDSRRSGKEPSLQILFGESGRLQVHVAVGVEDWKDARSIAVKLMMQDTFSAPAIQTYTFAALNQSN